MSTSMDAAQPPSIASRWEARLRAWPWWIFFVLVVGVGLFRSGFVIIRWEPDPLDSYPMPVESWSTLSYGSRTVTRLLGWDFPYSYVVISAVLVVIILVALAFLLRPHRWGVDGRLLAVLIVLGPIGQVLSARIGGHDSWVILGGLIVGILGRQPAWAIVGTVLMVLGNPEQAFLATGILCVLSWTPWLRDRRAPTLVAFALALIAFAGLSAYARVEGVGDRSGLLGTYLGNSVYNFGANLPLSLYAALGIGWIIVVWVMLRSSWPSRWLIVVAVIALPLLFTAITLDQTRVFVGVSTAAVVALMTVAVPQMRIEAESRGFGNSVFWVSVAGVFLPAVVVTFTGTVVVPHAWFFTGVLPQIKALVGG